MNELISMEELAPHDEIRSFSVSIKGKHGGEVKKLPVTYYPNRVTVEPLEFQLSDEESEELTERQISAIESSMIICHYLHSWDLAGPVKNNLGVEVVGAGQPVPLDPRIVQCLPLAINLAVINQLTEHVNPNERESRNSRRRSR